MVCMLTIGWMKIFTIFKIEPLTKKLYGMQSTRSHKVGWTTLKLLVACDGPTFSVDMMVRPDFYNRERGEGGAYWRWPSSVISRCLEEGERTNNNNYSKQTFRYIYELPQWCTWQTQSCMITNDKKHTNLCPYTEQIIFFVILVSF